MVVQIVYIGIPIEKGTLSLPWTPWRLSRFKVSQLQQSAARKPGRGIVLPATVQPQEVAMMGTTWCFSMISTFMMFHHVSYSFLDSCERSGHFSPALEDSTFSHALMEELYEITSHRRWETSRAPALHL